VKDQLYDVIIVGAAPAGLAAGIYAARDRYKTLILEKNPIPGGQILLAPRVENFPGHESISGPDLVLQMQHQAETFGAVLATGQSADGLSRLPDGLIKVSVNGEEKTYVARAVILAPGSHHRRLGVPGETEMRQAGRVSYCATCDGPFYQDKDVLVVGGGNTAIQDAAYLARRFTRRLILVHRRREFRAQKVLVEELYATAREKDVDVKLPYVVTEIVPNNDRTGIHHVAIRNVETDESEEVRVDGVFVLVGMVPNTDFLRGTVQMDEAGHIACDPVTLKTSVPGVFAAGDCRQGAPMQLVTACADGVVAALGLEEYFRDPSSWSEKVTESIRADGW